MVRIVYIDDEPDIASLFVDSFSTKSAQITCYTSPNEAVKIINSQKPDLVFLDYRLPGTTGDIVAQSIDPGIPKALITGELEVELKSKFVKVFRKPFDFGEIETFIHDFCETKPS